MSTPKKLSKITHIDLRECWGNEATDFTPWLSKEENIARLGEVLGFGLAVKAQEEHVGSFRADILCEEPDTGKLVLIENQLERTDHNHLGQILTYAAGLEAVSIVWIAEHFTEEHRAAVDWLNRITDSEFNFFGVEISVIKIDDSAPAPIFTIVAKPNGWSKEVHKVSQAVASEIKLAQKEFWSVFSEYMAANPSKLFHLQKPQPQDWAIVSMGTNVAHIRLKINSQKKKVSVRLEFADDADKHYFDALRQHKEAVEAAIGEPLEWQRLDGKKMSYVRLSCNGDFMNEGEYPALFAWFRARCERFVNVFKPLVKTL